MKKLIRNIQPVETDYLIDQIQIERGYFDKAYYTPLRFKMGIVHMLLIYFQHSKDHRN